MYVESLQLILVINVSILSRLELKAIEMQNKVHIINEGTYLVVYL